MRRPEVFAADSHPQVRSRDRDGNFSLHFSVQCLETALMSNPGPWPSIAAARLIFLLLLVGAPGPVTAADTLESIRQRGELLWGADAEGGAPFVFPDPQKPERLIGFEAELADALAARLGVKAEMVQNQWDQLTPEIGRASWRERV